MGEVVGVNSGKLGNITVVLFWFYLTAATGAENQNKTEIKLIWSILYKFKKTELDQNFGLGNVKAAGFYCLFNVEILG